METLKEYIYKRIDILIFIVGAGAYNRSRLFKIGVSNQILSRLFKEYRYKTAHAFLGGVQYI